MKPVLCFLLAALSLSAATSHEAYLVVKDTLESFDWQTNQRIWSDEFLATGGAGAIYGLAISADGKSLLLNQTFGDLHEINASTGQVTSFPAGAFRNGPAIFNPAAPLIYAVDGYGVIRIVCNVTHTILGGIGNLLSFPTGLAITPDGAYLYVGEFNAIQVIKTNPVQEVSVINSPSGEFDPPLAMSADGSALYVGSFNPKGGRDVRIYSTKTNTQMDVIHLVQGGVEAMAVSPDGKTLYTLTFSGNERFQFFIAAITLATDAVRYFSIPVPEERELADSMAITPDGSRLLITDINLTLWQVSADTGTVISSTSIGAHFGDLDQQIVTPPPPPPTTGPQLVSLQGLFGAESYDLLGAKRTRLPWQITGIRAVFSEPISNAALDSVAGATATALEGLGTDTLTWTVKPIANANTLVQFLSTGPSGIEGISGFSLNGGRGFQHSIRVLAGDFNDDGVVNAADITGLLNAHTQPYNIFADINGDGIAGDLKDINAASVYLGAMNK